jgi:hypothetical protein
MSRCESKVENTILDASIVSKQLQNRDKKPEHVHVKGELAKKI